MKNILITGISGQDGTFLTNEIFKKLPNSTIFGITRNKNKLKNNLNYLNKNIEFSKLNLFDVNLNDFSDVNKFIKEIKPDTVFNLTGPSSVYDSIKSPKIIKKQIIDNFDNLTNSLIQNNNFCNFFQASSSEMFGKNKDKLLNENSEFNPNSPYAEAKLENHIMCKNLNSEYNWNIVSGIMFNHESEFRADNFLFMKLINAALDIKKKNISSVSIGSLNYKRDWSYAKDVIQAVLEITLNPKRTSYVIGSGVGIEIKELVKKISSITQINLLDYLYIDYKLLRAGDPDVIVSDPTALKTDYSWTNSVEVDEIIEKIVTFKTKEF